MAQLLARLGVARARRAARQQRRYRRGGEDHRAVRCEKTETASRERGRIESILDYR